MLIPLIHLGRLAMVVWIIYALLLAFAPQFLGHAPDPYGGGLQAIVAYGIGWCLDRTLGFLRRREAERREATAAAAAPPSAPAEASASRPEI